MNPTIKYNWSGKRVSDSTDDDRFSIRILNLHKTRNITGYFSIFYQFLRGVVSYRFDEEGHGLGVEDKFSLDPSDMGYVQGYKETNTYDLKVSRPSSRSSLRPISRETSNLSRTSGPK